MVAQGISIDKLYRGRQESSILNSLLELDGAAALLRSLAVEHSARGTGLARRLIGALIDQARGRGVLRLFTFSKDTGNYFIRNGWVDVPLAEAVPQIENTAQVQHYHAVGWYADERALRLDLRLEVAATLSR